jgi:hypothetical protein
MCVGLELAQQDGIAAVLANLDSDSVTQTIKALGIHRDEFIWLQSSRARAASWLSFLGRDGMRVPSGSVRLTLLTVQQPGQATLQGRGYHRCIARRKRGQRCRAMPSSPGFKLRME